MISQNGWNGNPMLGPLWHDPGHLPHTVLGLEDSTDISTGRISVVGDVHDGLGRHAMRLVSLRRCPFPMSYLPVIQSRPVHHLRGQGMPRTSSSTRPTTARRRRTAQATDTRQVVTQITQLVAANESLKLENARLQALNEQLRSELQQIGSALGSLTGGARRGRGRRGAATLALPEAKPRRQRKPITDPEVLARRGAALVKARAARAEKLGAARAGAVE